MIFISCFHQWQAIWEDVLQHIMDLILDQLSNYMLCLSLTFSIYDAQHPNTSINFNNAQIDQSTYMEDELGKPLPLYTVNHLWIFNDF
jgi:hypothetical protein